MSSKGNLTLVSQRKDTDRWTISVHLTHRAIEVRNDLRGSLFVVTRKANGELCRLGSYDRWALARALEAAIEPHPGLGLDLAAAARLGVSGGAPPKRTPQREAWSGVAGGAGRVTGEGTAVEIEPVEGRPADA